MYLFLWFFLRLSPEQVVDTVVEESRLGLIDTCEFLMRIEKKEMFNLIYEKEIMEIYGNEKLFDDMKSKIQKQCCEQLDM